MSDNLYEAGNRYTGQIQSAILKRDSEFFQGTSSDERNSSLGFIYQQGIGTHKNIIHSRSFPASTQLLVARASVSRFAGCLSYRNARIPCENWAPTFQSHPSLTFRGAPSTLVERTEE